MYPQISLIEHNIYYQHRPRSPQSVSGGYGIKQATNHPENRRKRAR
ncbi:TPA_asm: hypothetical protein G4H14_004675 [Salmonella enterica subsp. enterica serovar Poona]|uniref:Uncharacterized protein n=1 Tax=Salmonella enterica subsp. enterica serovar Poona TaxID=436295 RepID=A0A731YGY5_SALET|nr:hypothetical protein [Salmonella enterica subsp. enterica serovar Poona]